MTDQCDSLHAAAPVRRQAETGNDLIIDESLQKVDDL